MIHLKKKKNGINVEQEFILDLSRTFDEFCFANYHSIALWVPDSNSGYYSSIDSLALAIAKMSRFLPISRAPKIY